MIRTVSIFILFFFSIEVLSSSPKNFSSINLVFSSKFANLVNKSLQKRYRSVGQIYNLFSSLEKKPSQKKLLKKIGKKLDSAPLFKLKWIKKNHLRVMVPGYPELFVDIKNREYIFLGKKVTVPTQFSDSERSLFLAAHFFQIYEISQKNVISQFIFPRAEAEERDLMGRLNFDGRSSDSDQRLFEAMGLGSLNKVGEKLKDPFAFFATVGLGASLGGGMAGGLGAFQGGLIGLAFFGFYKMFSTSAEAAEIPLTQFQCNGHDGDVQVKLDNKLGFGFDVHATDGKPASVKISVEVGRSQMEEGQPLIPSDVRSFSCNFDYTSVRPIIQCPKDKGRQKNSSDDLELLAAALTALSQICTDPDLRGDLKAMQAFANGRVAEGDGYERVRAIPAQQDSSK